MGLFSSIKRMQRKVGPASTAGTASGVAQQQQVRPAADNAVTLDDFVAEVGASGLEADWSEARLKRLFDVFDLDGNGWLEPDEFASTASQQRKLLAALEDALDDAQLPDGVDLDSLASATSKFTPAEATKAYATALEQCGGAAKLEEYKEEVDDLCLTVSQRGEPQKQNSAWETYNVEDFLAITTKDVLREYGERMICEFEAALKEKGLSCKLAVPTGKAIGRAKMKVAVKYGGDTSRLVDANRCTVECQNIDDLFKSVNVAMTIWDNMKGMVVELEDKFFNRCMEAGYRHVQMLVRFGACLWEVQFNTTAMLHAKHECGHKAYKTMRYVQESLLLHSMRDNPVNLLSLLSIPGVRAVANPNVVADKNGMRAIHHAAFRGSGQCTKLLLDIPTPANVFLMDAYGQLPCKLAMLNLRWDYAATTLLPVMLEKAPTLPEKEVDESLVASLRDAKDYVNAINPDRTKLLQGLDEIATLFNAVIQSRLKGLSKKVGGSFQGDGTWEVEQQHMVLPSREACFEFSEGMQPKSDQSFSFALHYKFMNKGTTKGAIHENIIASCHGDGCGWEFRYTLSKFCLMVTFGHDHEEIIFNSLDGAFFDGWHQAVFLLDYEEKLYSLYMDGKKVSESRFHNTYTSYNGHLMVGANPKWRDRCSFCGEVKNILCLDRLLEPQEIKTHALAATA